MNIDTKGLDNFLSKLGKLGHTEASLTKRIVEQVANNGEIILSNKYDSINYDLSGNKIPMVFSELIDDETAKIHAQGEQVAYIEFGTGNVGKRTVSPELLAKKAIVGASDYNSGYAITKDVPIYNQGVTSWRNKYIKVIGWYKPDYALSFSEYERYSRWISGIDKDTKIKEGSKRYYGALKRAYKYTHGTEGIRAGQQIYDTARELERDLPNIAREVIKEELK